MSLSPRFPGFPLPMYCEMAKGATCTVGTYQVHTSVLLICAHNACYCINVCTLNLGDVLRRGFRCSGSHAPELIGDGGGGISAIFGARVESGGRGGERG